MSRIQKKDPLLSKKIGERFIRAIEDDLGLSLARAAQELGYANPTTLYAVKKGKALPAPEKLALAGIKLRDRRGHSLDLHWVLTGERRSFFSKKREQEAQAIDDDIIMLIGNLNSEKRRALALLLSDAG